MEQANRQIATQAVTELARGFFLLIAIGLVLFLAMEEVLGWFPPLGNPWRPIVIGSVSLVAGFLARWLDHLMRRAALLKAR